MNRMNVNPLKIAVFALLGMLALAVAPAASAHTSLISQTPTDGDTLIELADVNLVFSEELLDLGNSVTLTDEDGTTIDLEVDLSVPRELIAPLPADLSAGDYVVDWRVVAADGHPLEDTIEFTYAPAVAPSPSPSESPSASASAAPSPSASTSPSAAAEPTDEVSIMPISAPVEEDSGSSALWWIIGIGLVVGAIVGFVMWRKSSKPAGSDNAPQE